MKNIGKPLLHLHGDDHVWAEKEGAFDADNYRMVSLDCGEIASPIKVEIDITKIIHGRGCTVCNCTLTSVMQMTAMRLHHS